MGKRRAQGRVTGGGSPARGRSSKRLSWWAFLIVPALLVVVVGVMVTWLTQRGTPSEGTSAALRLPGYLRGMPFVVSQAYAYGGEHPEVLRYIPCYCGCGQHSGHRSNHDCFVARHGASDDIVWEEHGST